MSGGGRAGMTDRELLEAAARAAGVDLGSWCEELDAFWKGGRGETIWNPLTDDGDALRLAVKLGIAKVLTLEIGPGGACVTFDHPHVEADEFQPLEGTFDPYAATRRAIVRAAAALGEKE